MMRSEIPSRREVEDHNLTHILFISWYYICLKERRSEHERRPNEGKGVEDRAVTTNGIDYMYLTLQTRQTEEQGRSEEARRWDDRSSWAWTGRLEEYTHTKESAKAAVTHGLRHESQQTSKSWE